MTLFRIFSDTKQLSAILVSFYLVAAASAVPLGNIGHGIAARDGATGQGYILFSPDGLSSRFSLKAGQSDSFAAVVYENGTWYYDDDSALVSFTPLVNDVLVAKVDFSADTVISLKGKNNAENGIRTGYLSGDLVISANQYNGVSDVGEFGITGTAIELNNLLPPHITSYQSGALSFDYFAERSKVHFVQISPDLQSWTFLDSVMEPGNGFYHSVGLTTSASRMFMRTATYESDSQNPGDEDFDNDGYTNRTELLDLGTSPLASTNTDGDGLLDEWEMYHFGSLALTDSSNTDGDWLTALEEYQLGRSPVVDDDADNDGWLDSEASKILNFDLSDAYENPGDVLPWADEDGDGISNAVEVAEGTGPLDPASPATVTYTPLVDLRASDFTADGSVVSWINHGSLGGLFLPGGQSPQAGSELTKRCVRFSSGTEDWLKGDKWAVQTTGAGSRTVIAWVYNPDVTTSQSDVLASWGGVATGSAERRLFSVRHSGQSGHGAVKLSGNGGGEQAWGNGVTPVQSQWSFVVFRYNLADGSMLALQDFVAGLNALPLSMNTGALNAAGNPHYFVVGGDSDASGNITSQSTSLSIGQLYIYDQALPVSEILALYNDKRAYYGKPAMADADSDGVPDVLETSLGLSNSMTDTDGDGISDAIELHKGTDAKDFFNGRAHYVQVTSGDTQTITEGEETPAAITFKVMDADGEAIANAPVNLTVPTGGGEIRLDSSGSPLNTNLSTSADANGEVKVRFKSNE